MPTPAADGSSPRVIGHQVGQESEKRGRLEAYAANVRFAAAIAEGLHEVWLTRETARLLGLLVLEGHASGLAARGLRYVREDWQQVETRELKSGEKREKVVYLEPPEARERLYEFEAARTPEQMLGRLVQALVAARCTDDGAVAASNRAFYDLPGVFGGGAAKEIPELVEVLAEPHLPVRLAEQLRERRERRAGIAAAVASRDEEDEVLEELDPVDEVDEDAGEEVTEA